jgi:hypothetical protein
MISKGPACPVGRGEGGVISGKGARGDFWIHIISSLRTGIIWRRNNGILYVNEWKIYYGNCADAVRRVIIRDMPCREKSCFSFFCPRIRGVFLQFFACHFAYLHTV